MWELRITGNTYKYVYTVFLAFYLLHRLQVNIVCNKPKLHAIAKQRQQLWFSNVVVSVATSHMYQCSVETNLQHRTVQYILC